MRVLFLSSLVCLLAAGSPLPAYIERIYSLDEILEESTHVLTGKVLEVDPKRQTIIASGDKALEGEREYERLQWNVGAGDGKQARFLLGLIQKGDPMILFYQRNEESIQAVAHCGDVWFQLFASHEDDDAKAWWRFTHLEIYLPRTFRGSTPELIRLVEDVVAGRRKAPLPDPSVPKLDISRLDAGAALARKGRGREGAAPERVIALGSPWKYRKGSEEASPGKPGAWRVASFDDSGWESGKAPFGYGDGPYGTELPDMMRAGEKPGYTSVYLRRSFQVPRRSAVVALRGSARHDDGFILWLNGRRALALNAPAGEPAHDALAPANHEAGAPEPFEIEDPSRFLVDGPNQAAAQVFNRDLASSDLVFDMELVIAARPQEKAGGFAKIAEHPGASGEVRGISWADVDSNEKLDALFCRGGGNVLLLNEGGSFADGAERVGLSGGSRSAAWADLNGDDHADLLTSDFKVYRNRGGKLELDEKLIAAPENGNPEGAGWIDANGDGLPDVLITNAEHGILLLENTGKDEAPGRFRDVSAERGLGASGLGKGNGDFVAFADCDGDGFGDFLYNLGGGLLARNEGNGAFVPREKTGIDLPGGSAFKRGVIFADMDADGDMDLFVPAASGGRLFRNENDGSFRDVTGSTGALGAEAQQSFSAAWGDVNHDGHLDLLVCFLEKPARLYLGNGKGEFTSPGAVPGLEGMEPAFAASFADVDDDGDLDLALNLERRVLVLENRLAKVPGRAPLRVRLHVRKGIIGSVVRVLDEENALLGMRELNGAEGCGGQSSPVAHVAVPVGTCSITAVLSDGRVAQKKIEVPPEGAFVTLSEAEFEG